MKSTDLSIILAPPIAVLTSLWTIAQAHKTKSLLNKEWLAMLVLSSFAVYLCGFHQMMFGPLTAVTVAYLLAGALLATVPFASVPLAIESHRRE